MNNYKITVTTASGIEAVTKNELIKLGYGGSGAINGAITFDGDAQAVARCNMFLRTADRVYLNVAEYHAETFDQLFDGAASIPWEDYITKDGKILVDGKSVKSQIYALSASQSVIKKAIVTRLYKAYNTTTLEENGAAYNIEFAIFKDEVTLMINTSGQGLHKRGYRNMVGTAPIKETLASAMLLLSDFYYKRPLFDPFCGSGTLILEGARIALNIAAGINRSFQYMQWDNFDKTVYDKAYEEAKSNELYDRELTFVGSDNDPNAIELANYHAERAGLTGKVKFEVKDVRKFWSDLPNGVIITNPPYGERLLELKEAESLYRSLGETFKKLNNWSLFIIANDANFERVFGKRADKNRKLYNSSKECHFYEYFNIRGK